MRVDFYGLAFETPQVTFHLWSPWRATSLEHKLYDALTKALPRVDAERLNDESRVKVTDPKAFRLGVQALARVLKGWQEEADPGSERRTWRWLVDGDTDADGYDHNGEPVTLFAYLRVSVDRGGPSDPEKGEDVDLEGFTMRIWGEVDSGARERRN